MAAGISDHFTEATNGTRPSPTTLTAIHTIGQTTMTVGALTGWPTATAVHFIIYTIDASGNKVAGSQTDWKGIAGGGTSITSCVLKAGSDAGYSVGAIVEAAPTAAWANDAMDGVLVQHVQDGTHGAITGTSIATTGNISTSAGTINAATVSSLQDTSVALSTYRTETQFPFTASGGVWTADSAGVNRNGSMTAWTGYINGQRGTISAVTAHTFTASKDTYVDVLNTAGVFTIVYTEATNNAASPALAANSMRIAIVVTAAGSIAAAGSINQGDTGSLVPIASSIPYAVTDSLGNLICNRNSSPGVIGYKQILADATNAATSATLVAGLTCPVIIPTGRKVKITFHSRALYTSAVNVSGNITIWDGTVGSGAQLASGRGFYTGTGSAVSVGFTEAVVVATGSKTYNIGLHASTAATATVEAGTLYPAFVKVELV